MLGDLNSGVTGLLGGLIVRNLSLPSPLPSILPYVSKTITNTTVMTQTSYSTSHDAGLQPGVVPPENTQVDPEFLLQHIDNQDFLTMVDPPSLITGLVGNVFLMVVFLVSPLRLRPLSHVLTAMGVVDFMYIFACGVVYVNNMGLQVYGVPGLCQGTSFMLMFSTSIQQWYLLLAHIGELWFMCGVLVCCSCSILPGVC